MRAWRLLRSKMLLTTALSMAVAGPMVLGRGAAAPSVQSTTTGNANTSKASSGDAKGQAFEVASVRISAPGGDGRTSASGWGTPRFAAKNATLQLLLGIAFGVDETQIVGAPKWIESQVYDVDAKVEGDAGVSFEQMQPLIQQLLKERFHLVVHREMKDVAGYALIVAKDGPKLQAGKDGPAYGQIMPDRLMCPNCTVTALSGMLTRITERPVVDKSEIKGNYDIQLRYAPEGATDSTLPSLLTAIQEQAGLKLVPQKVPVERLVIDHVDREPVEN